jgi:uncharacterized protein
VSPAMIAYLRGRFVLDWQGIHGAPHWARVRLNGLTLAETTGANAFVVALFAFVHDCCREHDGGDHQHGRRAAVIVDALRADFIRLSDEEAGLLQYACAYHSDGLIDADVTVQTCWDADRLDLGRVGIRPDPDRLCTPAARSRGIIESAYRRSLRYGRERGWLWG